MENAGNFDPGILCEFHLSLHEKTLKPHCQLSCFAGLIGADHNGFGLFNIEPSGINETVVVLDTNFD
jgi:hypothetical protein